LAEHRQFEPSNDHVSNRPTERKDLQHKIDNEGMYLIVGEDGLELRRAEENGENVLTGMVFPKEFRKATTSSLVIPPIGLIPAGRFLTQLPNRSGNIT
jgi:hypothetical protein